MAAISDISDILKDLPPVERHRFKALNDIADSLDNSQVVPPQVLSAIAHLGNLTATMKSLTDTLTSINTTQQQLATAVQSLSNQLALLNTWNG